MGDGSRCEVNAMQTVKKYANRKLYHTNRKQYITLEGIAELIQAGEPVQVIDNETGQDITAQILSQVVLLARGRRTVLPPQLLTDMIQSGGDTLAGFGRSVWSTLSGAASVDDEIKRRIRRLNDDGTLSADEATRIEELLLDARLVEKPPELAHAAGAGDVARLNAEIENLTAAIDQLLAEQKSADQER
jgi:polyhydroxyalkanoate synthesis repressor PhaR